MEETRSRIKPKKQIAPKITDTKITISKSTPFLISKHHLDDTQMRNALNYDDRTVKNHHQRTYSYKGEVVSCVNSKIKQRFETFQSPSNPISCPQEKTKRQQYYPEMQNKCVQVEQRALKSRIHSNQGQPSKVEIRNNKERKLSKDNNIYGKVGVNDYGMQEKHLAQAKKSLQKQTERLKKLYKKNVEKDLRLDANHKIVDLQGQIKQLKIKNLQLQKQRLLLDYQRSMQIIDHQKIQKINLKEHGFHDRQRKGYSILSKPRYKIKHQMNEDTDSSFSSFELD